MPTPQDAPAPPTPRRPRRRKWLWTLGIAALVLGGGYLLLTRSFVTRAIVLRQVGALLGGDLSADSLTIDPDGRILATGASLRARGVVGDAGVVLTVKRLEAQVEWWSVLRGEPVVHSLILDEPVARLSQSVDDNSVNVAALTPRDLPRSTPRAFPRVLVRQGALELGEHITDRRRLASGEPPFRSLRKIPVSGEVERSPGEQGEMLISFRELDEHGRPLAGPGGLQVEGHVSDAGIRLDLGVISLSGWSVDSMPAPIRQQVRDLKMEGLIYGSELEYSYTDGVRARAHLSGVAMTLPVECQPDTDLDGNPLPIRPEDAARRLRLERVTGELALSRERLHGDLTGYVEELPYHVRFDFEGATVDAPFTCTIECDNFRMERKPDVLKFAPGLVRRRLQQFSDPTGLVDLNVTLARGKPGADGPAPVDVKGTLRFRGATAAFERFPYRFHNMTGEIAFTDHSIEIRHIEGDSPAGARLNATGLISPLTDAAGVEVKVQVRELPVDAPLAAAMQSRGRLIDELCNGAEYARLLAAGLLTDPAHAAGATPDAPLFALGGPVDVLAVVTRDPGEHGEWHDTITITMPRVGLLPRSVPFPMIAEGVTIIKTDDLAEVKGGTLRGIQGGSARLAARADLKTLADPGAPFAPEIEVEATDVPVTRLLLAALPPGPQGAVSPAQALSALGLSGAADATIRVMPAPDAVGYQLDIRPRTLRAAPPGPDGSPRVAASAFQGVAHVSHEAVDLDLRAGIESQGAPAGELALRLHAARSRAGRLDALDIEASTDAIALAAAIEDFIRPFDPAAAGTLDALRADRAPRGVAGGVVRLKGGGARPIGVEADVRSARDASVQTPAGRTGFTITEGRAHLTLPGGDAPGLLRLDRLAATLTTDGRDDGTVAASGATRADGAPAGEAFELEFRGTRFESPLVRWWVDAHTPAGVVAFVRDSNPRGVFDLRASLTPRDAAEWDARGVFTPRELTLRLNNQDVGLQAGSGAVEFQPGRGLLRDLTFSGKGWTIAAKGAWLVSPERTAAIQADLHGRSTGADSEFFAVLPERLRATFDELKFPVPPGLSLEPLSLSLNYNGAGDLVAFKASGKAGVTGASLEPGLRLTDASGLIEFTAERNADQPGPSFELWGLFDSLRAGNVAMTDARVRVTGLPSGEVYMPHFSADCHGGRFTADAVVTAPAPAGRTFTTTAQMSGVRFAPILADLTPKHPVIAGEESPSPDGSRGVLDANLTLTGLIGDESSRRGRGTGTISGGRILSLPLLVPLIRVSNLELPLDEKLDFAASDFYIHGPFFNFEELAVFSRSVEVLGFGTMRWPGTELDLRFRPKARTRIPVVTPVLEGLRNELIAAQVQGTLAQPQVEYTTLTGTSRFIGTMFGETPTEQDKRLDAIEKRARQNPRATPRNDAPIRAPR